jgi:hypothetical protein
MYWTTLLEFKKLNCILPLFHATFSTTFYTRLNVETKLYILYTMSIVSPSMGNV